MKVLFYFVLIMQHVLYVKSEEQVFYVFPGLVVSVIKQKSPPFLHSKKKIKFCKQTAQARQC